MINNNPGYVPYEILFPDEGVINESINNVDSGGIWKYATYGQLKINLDRFTVTAGLRFDQVAYNNTASFSPRIGASYSITSLTKVNMAYGKYYQTPFYWMLMNPKNKHTLKHSFTNQYVVGVEHYFAEDIKGTIEVYNKTYHNNKKQYRKLYRPRKKSKRNIYCALAPSAQNHRKGELGTCIYW